MAAESASLADSVATTSAAPPSAARELASLPIRFDKGMTAGAIQDAAELDRMVAGIVREMSAQPNAKLEVGGHTSREGSAEVNVQLGQARAEHAVPLLVQRGVPAERIRVKNYTSSSPADRQATSGWDPNRRVTARVVD